MAAVNNLVLDTNLSWIFASFSLALFVVNKKENMISGNVSVDAQSEKMLEANLYCRRVKLLC
ncbi:hypothetical protein GCM10007852_33940 [Agaribacter marinus]|uniref:Uncharacterized protein n=1 Tax=Agaribacter marinus TaxID=1431249 RepID=A0AA37SZV6_9ALTE|nr:hypothetical protein GCM10007852_33940 [Agaribacter marinus]